MAINHMNIFLNRKRSFWILKLPKSLQDLPIVWQLIKMEESSHGEKVTVFNWGMAKKIVKNNLNKSRS